MIFKLFVNKMTKVIQKLLVLIMVLFCAFIASQTAVFEKELFAIQLNSVFNDLS